MSTIYTVAELSTQTAAPQHGNSPYSKAAISAQLAVLDGWSFDGDRIVKTYRFANYYQTMAFVNIVAAIAHATDHHPDLIVSYSRCEVAYNTHDVGNGQGGISINDFIAAARIEQAAALSAPS